jgi:uncharacterized protein involved in exopolysaccharide biosynthesis
MDAYEGRIDLLQYFRVIWGRKWLILSATLLCALLGGIYSFLQPTQWNVDAIIQGGKFFNYENHQEVLIIPGEQLAGQINEGYYHNALASDLGLALKDIPGMKAKSLRWTDRVNVSIKTSDGESAKRVLQALFRILQKELDKRIDFERNNQDVQIKQYENIIQTETQAIQSRESEIDSLRRKGGSGLTDQTIRQLNTELGVLKIVRETHKKDLQQLIATFGASELTQFIKEPAVSPRPVAPQKTLNILIAGLLGFVIFTALAFMLEYLEKLKQENIRAGS